MNLSSETYQNNVISLSQGDIQVKRVAPFGLGLSIKGSEQVVRYKRPFMKPRQDPNKVQVIRPKTKRKKRLGARNWKRIIHHGPMKGQLSGRPMPSMIMKPSNMLLNINNDVLKKKKKI